MRPRSKGNYFQPPDFDPLVQMTLAVTLIGNAQAIELVSLWTTRLVRGRRRLARPDGQCKAALIKIKNTSAANFVNALSEKRVSSRERRSARTGELAAGADPVTAPAAAEPGSEKMNVAPPPGTPVISKCPPWSASTRLAMAGLHLLFTNDFEPGTRCRI